MEEHPKYSTKEEACAADGEIYQHFKGGVYRLIQRGVRHSETLEVGVLYEHLWPRDYGFWFRPEELFFGTLEDGTPRFTRVK